MSDGKRPLQNQETRKASSTPKDQPSSRKHQRKAGNPVRFSPTAEQSQDVLICRNSTCRASLSPDVLFCKRCCCSICHSFDDGKDPSLWLVCEPESGCGYSCGLSCHIECALLHERVGVVALGKWMQLDGSYRCASCGKVTGILGCWKKQLTIAKDAERVDILRFRISLSYKLLDGTSRFSELHELVRDAKAKLEADVGLLDEISGEMARGAVSRLPCAGEVQKLISLAIEKADEWMAAVSNRAQEQCFSEGIPGMHIKESGEFRGTIRPETPPLPHAFDLNIASMPDLNDGLISPSETFRHEDNVGPSKHTMNNADDASPHIIARSHASGDSQNWALVSAREVPAVGSHHTGSMKRALSPHQLTCEGTSVQPLRISNELAPPDELEHCLKTMRWLENEGYIKPEFRLKMFTWFSTRATEQQRGMVSTFIRTMLDDPSSLAEQLVDTYSDIIHSRIPRG